MDIQELRRKDDLQTARYMVRMARVERGFGFHQRAVEALNLAGSIRRNAGK